MKKFFEHEQKRPLAALAVAPGNSNALRASEIRIIHFPAEFEKSFWKGLDKRIVTIFLFNFAVIYGFLIAAASSPKSAGSDQLDMRLLTRLTGVMRVDPRLLEELALSDRATENVVTPNADRVINKSPGVEILRRNTVESARRAAEERFRKASENIAGRGILAVIGVERREKGKYANYDFSAQSIGFDPTLHRLNGLVEVAGKKLLGIAGDRTRASQSIAELITINGGEELISVKAGDAGGGLVGLGKTTLGGGNTETVTASGIQAVVDQNAEAIISCYQKELKRKPDLKGKLSVQIRINPAGLVKGVTINQNTVNADMATCIQNKIRAWKFPQGRKGMVTVSQTFVFTK